MTANLLEELRRLQERRPSRRVVLDPELRANALHEGFERRPRCARLLFVELEGRHLVERALEREVVQVAAEHDRLVLDESDEERLMARRVARCGFDYDAAVAEDVVVAVEKLRLAVLERLVRIVGA